EQGGAQPGDSFDLDTVTLTQASDGELIANPSCERGLGGWETWQATSSLVAGADGANAARVTFNGTGNGYAYTTNPRPVLSTTAGRLYHAQAQVRSATPGKRLCLVLREWATPTTIQAITPTCLTATSAWQWFPPLTYTTQTTGGSLELYVEQGGAQPGDSFDLDSMPLTLSP